MEIIKKVALLSGLMLSTFSVVTMDMSDLDMYRRVCRKYPSDYLCKQTLKQLNRLYTDITTCCTEVSELFTQIEAQGLGSGCFCPVEIDQQSLTSGGNLPGGNILNPGYYCLVDDVSGTLRIAANNVIVNLNGYEIRTTTSQTVISIGGAGSIVHDVIVRNGSIRGVNSSTGISSGDNTNNILIEDINFGRQNTTALGTGINITGTSTFVINRCLFSNTQTALELSGSREGKISNCLVQNCSTSASVVNASDLSSVVFTQNSFSNNSNSTVVDVVGCDSCVFKECNVDNNSGAVAVNFDNSSNCFCLLCQANQNSSAIGFEVVNGSTRIVFDACRSLNNNTGFWLDSVNQNCIFNSFAQQNSVDGFLVNDGANNYIHANTAINNTGAGFAGTGSNVWTSNFAQANGTNYTVGIPGPFAVFDLSDAMFTSTETAWDNITVQP